MAPEFVATPAAHRPRIFSKPTTTFRDYYEAEKAEGTFGVADGQERAAHYLPEDALRRYVSEANIQSIYTQIYERRDHPATVQMVDAAHAHRKYRKVLATLLYIGRGDLFDSFYADQSLNDKHLPFYERSERFPGSDHDFALFYDAQWKFCVLPIKYRHIADWHSRQILPFKNVEKLGQGSDGKAYLIEIHPAHNRLACPTATVDGQPAESTETVQTDAVRDKNGKD